MRVKLFGGVNLATIERQMNDWITSTQASIVDAKITCGHPGIYVVLVTYEYNTTNTYVDATDTVQNDTRVTTTNTN